MPPTIGEEVEAQGWVTGSVVALASVREVAPHLQNPGQALTVPADGDWLVVVSQTCDIIATTLQAEPFIEILHCRPIAKLRKGKKKLESTRYLDFKPNSATHPGVFLAAHAALDRYMVPRAHFMSFAPDATRKLSVRATAAVTAWYGLRYSRPAWPDAFVARVSAATPELEAALEPLTADESSEVRVAIREWNRELGNGEKYNISVYFVIDVHLWTSSAEARTVFVEAFAKFVELLNKCDGVLVDAELSGVLPGDQFTWQDTVETDLWNFARLSQRDE